MGNMVCVKTTLEIQDILMARAKKLAKRTGRPLRALVEEGLRLVLAANDQQRSYELPDCSVGKRGDPNPLEGLSWQDLREEMYGNEATGAAFDVPRR
jgi:hypothetical protein